MCYFVTFYFVKFCLFKPHPLCRALFRSPVSTMVALPYSQCVYQFFTFHSAPHSSCYCSLLVVLAFKFCLLVIYLTVYWDIHVLL